MTRQASSPSKTMGFGAHCQAGCSAKLRVARGWQGTAVSLGQEVSHPLGGWLRTGHGVHTSAVMAALTGRAFPGTDSSKEP